MGKGSAGFFRETPARGGLSRRGRRAAALPLRPAEPVRSAARSPRGRPGAHARRPFSGGAGECLPLLTENILPQAEALLPASPAWRGLAGYSLAGLFAIWALYQTDIFSRAASMSGSLWYPGLLDYLSARTPPRRPDCLYLSLGDREARARDTVLKTVRRETEAVAAHFRARGIPTALEFPPGNHFQNVTERMAAGIGWLLGR